jgi:glucose uptake protein GlcU
MVAAVSTGLISLSIWGMGQVETFKSLKVLSKIHTIIDIKDTLFGKQYF